MAVTSIWRVKSRLDKVVSYVENPAKIERDAAPEQGLDDVIGYAVNAAKTVRTDNEATPVLRSFVSGVNCSPATAQEEMMAVKRKFGKEDGTIAYHGYQSFAPGEATPELAHEIGLKLAQRLWGDRYQVVVATHLDKENHLHSHFVLNTVSFIDGVKYHRTERDYREMQRLSDELCQEYGLSTIEHPKNISKSYSEWQAEGENRPTVRGTIRADIDAAIAGSATRTAFINALAAKGYVFKMTGENGKPLKYPGLKPPGAKGFFRFAKLGDGYSLSDIDHRIVSRQTIPFPDAANDISRPSSPPPYRKHVTGLRGLYFRYCYELHIIVKHPASVKRVPFSMREDLRKLEQYDRVVRFLAAKKIATMSDLDGYRAVIHMKIENLTETRKQLRLQLKGISEPDGALAEKEVREINEELRKLRKEVKLCESIAETSTAVRENLEQFLDLERTGGEKDEQLYKRRSRTGREDVP